MGAAPTRLRATQAHSLLGARFRGDRHRGLRRREARAPALDVDLGELGPQEKDLRGVVHPDDDDDERPGRPVRRGDGALAQIEADQELADGEEQRRDGRPEPHVSPGDLHVGQELERHGEQRRDHRKGGHEVQGFERCGGCGKQPAEVRADRHHPGTERERDEQHEPDADDHREGQEPLPEHGDHAAPRPRRDPPDRVEPVLKLPEDAPEPERQRDQRQQGPAHAEGLGACAAEHRLDRLRSLLADQLANLPEDLHLGVPAEEEPGHGDQDDEPGGEREDRVVREGGADALSPILVPVADGGAEQ